MRKLRPDPTPTHLPRDMNDSASTSAMTANAMPHPQASRRLRPNFGEKIALRLLDKLAVGELELVLPDGSVRIFKGRTGQGLGMRAHLAIHDMHALSLAMSRGDIGFGEGYMRGLWSSHDLSMLLRLLTANREAVSDAIYGHWWALLVDQLRHLLRSNRKSQARKNIAAHYDLGNAFYKEWLDPSMTYSSALFDGTGRWGEAVDLESGQLHKMDRAIAELNLERLHQESRVLEIGCGWGGLANRLLAQCDADYKGLTLSVEQRQWARDVLEHHGRHRFDIALQDYRDEHALYDGIVSIEMFEAVGEQYWDAYFQTVKRCLKPDGRAVIQSITIDDRLFDKYRHGTDFIQRYIFPGGMLPSPKAFESHARQCGLRVERAFWFGQDYARTLAEWAKRFDDKHDVIRGMGFDESFVRMWKFYLSYCEAGFAEGNLNVAQFTLTHAS